MTQEHITITEEVQQNGELKTVERETLQTTVPTPEDIKGQQAYGVTHPGYISAQDRVYEYDPEIGMSRSEPADVALPVEEETELAEDEPVTEQDLDDATEEKEPLTEEEIAFAQAKVESNMFSQPATCDHPVGNGTCVLEEGHSGAHRLTA